MKTAFAITRGLVIGVIVTVAIHLVSCAPRAFPVGPNPLDEPGMVEPTAADLHAENIGEITENPARTLW